MIGITPAKAAKRSSTFQQFDSANVWKPGHIHEVLVANLPQESGHC